MTAADVDGLIAQILAGDVEAYAGVVRRYQRDVWGVVSAMLRGPKATEDLVQQTFVEAYRHLGQYRPGSDFGAWLKSIARNMVRAELRSHSRETRRMEVYRQQLSRRLEDEGAAVRRDEAVAEALRHCRSQLPEHSAQVLDLRYVKAQGFEEIASGLGRSVEATRQMLFRVRLLLRDCIERKLAEG